MEEYVKTFTVVYLCSSSIPFFLPLPCVLCSSKFSIINMCYSYKGIQIKYTGVYIHAQRASDSLSSAGSMTKGHRKN